MKRLNKDDTGIDEWRRGLDTALELALPVSRNFRRAVDGGPSFKTSASVQTAIWDTTTSQGKVLGGPSGLRRPDGEAPRIREAADQGTEARVAAFEDAIQNLLAGHNGGAVSSNVRVAMIKEARRVEAPCPLCGEALGPSDDLLHIDHIVPLARGSPERKCK